MADEINQTTAPDESGSYRDVPILPDGWDGESDIFAGVESEEKSLEELFNAATVTDDGQLETHEPAPTTEQTAEDQAPGTETQQEVPTIEPTETPTEKRRLKFKAKYNHQEQDVDIDEDDLPNIYQKSLFADSLQEKLKKADAEKADIEALAKAMKYENGAAMIAAARDNFRKSEIERLVDDGASEEVAEWIVDQRMGLKPAAATPEPTTVQEDTPAQEQNAPAERDFQKEVAQLVKAYPELKGSGPLPQEVVDATIKGGRSLIEAYTSYKAGQAEAELKKLKNENQILKQNAASAARAPVTGVSGGGATDTKPVDPFLEGFNSRYY